MFRSRLYTVLKDIDPLVESDLVAVTRGGNLMDLTVTVGFSTCAEVPEIMTWGLNCL